MTATTDPPLTFDEAVRLRLAVADQKQFIARLTALELNGGRMADPHPWYTTLGQTVLRRVSEGTARLCPHLGPGRGVGPMYTVMQAGPMRIRCSTCWSDNTQPLDPVDGMICDRCGTYAQRIVGGALPLGPLMIIFGLCSTCDDELEQDSRPNRAARRGHRGHGRGRSNR